MLGPHNWEHLLQEALITNKVDPIATAAVQQWAAEFSSFMQYSTDHFKDENHRDAVYELMRGWINGSILYHEQVRNYNIQ